MKKLTLALIGSGAVVTVVACGSSFSGAEAGGASSSTTTTTTSTETSSTGGAGVSTVSGGPGGGGSGPTSSSSVTPGQEDCFNGQDDNGDGKIDCADADCSSKASCASAADGWHGPFLVEFGDATAPGCPIGSGGGLGLLFTELPATIPDAKCECKCGDPAVCNAGVTLGVTSSTPCMNVDSATLTANACETNSNAITTSYGALTYLGTPGPLTCAVTVDKTLAVVDTKTLRVCDSPDAAGCDDAGKCLPDPKGMERVCVSLDGDHDCPTAYGDRHVVDAPDTIMDSRDCGAGSCGCDYDMAATCAGTIELYTTNDCSGAAADEVATGTSCQPFQATDVQGIKYVPTDPRIVQPDGERRADRHGLRHSDHDLLRVTK